VHHSSVVRRLAAFLVVSHIVTSPAVAAETPRHRETQTVYRINVGGPKIGASVRWDLDTTQSPSPYMSTRGRNARIFTTTRAIDMTHPSVPAGTPERLFRTERWDRPAHPRMAWDLPTPPGTYEVRLYFAAIYGSTQRAGARVFDVAIEKKLVLDNYDTFGDVGGYKAVVKSFVVTSDGNIDIDFGHVIKNPNIAAIEVLPTDGSLAPPIPSPSPTPTPAPSPSPPPGPSTPAPNSPPTANSKCAGVVLQPESSIQSAIDSNPPGTTFCLMAGVYRPSAPLVAKSGDRFIGQPGALVSGAREVNGWVRSGDLWAAPGPTSVPAQAGKTKSGFEGARYPDDVFVNDKPLRRVLNLAQVGPGTVFVDYSAGKIYVADSPVGKKVEIATISKAFKGLQTSIANVVIKGLVIEKFASLAQTAAVESRNDWLIEKNEVRLNHGIGISAGSRTIVRNNYVHHNGQLGVASSGGEDIVFEGNEIAYNNTLGFSPSWEAGGSKFLYTSRLVARKNYVHDNDGPGLWTDVNNINTLYEDNRVENNSWAGILHEVSYDAVIRNNHTRGNGFGSTWWGDGAGILAASSPNVEIYGNTVENNKNGVILFMADRSGDAAPFGPHVTSNSNVHDNVIKMTTGYTGLIQQGNDNSLFTDRKNRFEGNTYHLDSSSAQRWHWMNAPAGREKWRSFGNDLEGAFH
jgi:hypothetical protein